MALLQSRRTRAAALLLVATLALTAWARSTTAGKPESDLPSLETLSLAELDDRLQVRLPFPPHITTYRYQSGQDD
jgi:hypothetical protein